MPAAPVRIALRAQRFVGGVDAYVAEDEQRLALSHALAVTHEDLLDDAALWCCTVLRFMSTLTAPCAMTAPAIGASASQPPPTTKPRTMTARPTNGASCIVAGKCRRSGEQGDCGFWLCIMIRPSASLRGEASPMAAARCRGSGATAPLRGPNISMLPSFSTISLSTRPVARAVRDDDQRHAGLAQRGHGPREGGFAFAVEVGVGFVEGTTMRGLP